MVVCPDGDAVAGQRVGVVVRQFTDHFAFLILLAGKQRCFVGNDTERQMAAALFGANLLGATLGGFLEYLGMVIGTGALSALIIAAYIASLWFLRISHTQGAVLESA